MQKLPPLTQILRSENYKHLTIDSKINSRYALMVIRNTVFDALRQLDVGERTPDKIKRVAIDAIFRAEKKLKIQLECP